MPSIALAKTFPEVVDKYRANGLLKSVSTLSTIFDTFKKVIQFQAEGLWQYAVQSPDDISRPSHGSLRASWIRGSLSQSSSAPAMYSKADILYMKYSETALAILKVIPKEVQLRNAATSASARIL